MSMTTTTVPATDIRDIHERPRREGDTEISVTVMRSCTFLYIRQNGTVILHADISPGDWQKFAGSPAPVDDQQDQENPS